MVHTPLIHNVKRILLIRLNLGTARATLTNQKETPPSSLEETHTPQQGTSPGRFPTQLNHASRSLHSHLRFRQMLQFRLHTVHFNLR